MVDPQRADPHLHVGQFRRNLHQIVREHGCADQQLEALDALGATTLHTAAAEQHGDAALDAGPEALASLEACTLLVGGTLRRSLAAALRDALHADAVLCA